MPEPLSPDVLQVWLNSWQSTAEKSLPEYAEIINELATTFAALPSEQQSKELASRIDVATTHIQSVSSLAVGAPHHRQQILEYVRSRINNAAPLPNRYLAINWLKVSTQVLVQFPP